MIKKAVLSSFFKYSVLLVLAALLNSCGFWTNFKTYFNTYYNANKIFEKAEQELLDAREEMFYYEEKPTPSNLNKEFDVVIEKTSAILQHNKESDYIEEALLMTGKSFYYQQNYSRALRKFNELSLLKESELLLENKLWTAKAYLQLREFDKGVKLIDDVITEAKQVENEEVLIEAYNTYIGYLIYTEDYATAVSEINEYLETNIDDEHRAEVLYEMGRMYKLTENYEAAAEAFLKVGDYSPSFGVDFNSKFESAIIKGELGEVDKSLELLEDLRDEDKFSDRWGDIDLEIGKIFYDRHEIEDALDKFTEVDTTYPKTEAASIAGFYRAEILENEYHDYDSALVFYTVAAKSIAPPTLRDAAQKKSELLNKYLSFHETLNNLELQYLYLTDENAFIQDSLEVIEKIRQDSIKSADEDRSTAGVSERGARRNNRKSQKYIMPVRPKIPVDSIKALNSKNYFELANLLFSEFNDPDSAYYYYKLSLEEKPNNPNEAQTFYAIGNYFLIKDKKDKADSMFTIVYDKFEFDPIRNEAAKQIGKPLYDFDKDPVEDEYVKAEEVLYGKEYRKAISSFFKIYEEHPKSIYASKSLYAIGFILENELDMPDSAASVYDTLSAKYSTSIYSKSILRKLSAYKQENLNTNLDTNTISQPEPDVQNEVEDEISDSIEGSVDDTKSTNIPTKNIKKDKNSIQDSIKSINPNKVEDTEIKVEQNKNNSAVNKSSSGNNSVKSDITIVSRDIYKDNEDYYVQVSSWKTKKFADEEVQKLSNLNYNAFIVSIFVKEKDSIYHRVRVGPYDSFLAAKKVREKLNKY